MKWVNVVVGILLSMQGLAVHLGQDDGAKSVIVKCQQSQLSRDSNLTVWYFLDENKIEFTEHNSMKSFTPKKNEVQDELILQGSYPMPNYTTVSLTLKIPALASVNMLFRTTLEIKKTYSNIGGTIDNDPNMAPPVMVDLQCTVVRQKAL